jgi:hypothetical protein
MTRPPSRRRAIGLVACWVLAATTALACDAAESTGPELPVGDVNGPWQATPFGVTREVVASALAACRAQPPEPRPGPGGLGPVAIPDQPILIDARGMGRLHILFADRGRAFDCGLGRRADGGWDAGVEASGTHEGSVPPDGEARALAFSSVESNDDNGHREASTLVVGRFGAGVAGVQLVFGDGRTVRATSNATWFVAWWPSDDAAARIQELDASGQPLGPPHD